MYIAKMENIFVTGRCEEVVVFDVLLELLYFELTHLGAKGCFLLGKFAKLIALFW